MKTPREIVNEALKGDLEPPIEYQSYEDAVLHAMKEYAKQWVTQVVKEISDSPHGNENMITYYHLAIDAQ